MLLDVLDDEVRSGKVINARWTLWVVHCICHITHQGDIFPELHHLPNPERTPQNTHVKVHSTKDDILNFPFGQKVPGLLTIVGDGVTLHDLNNLDLSGPGLLDFTFLPVATATHIRVINWKHALEFWIGPTPVGAPSLFRAKREGCFCKGGRFSQLPLRSLIVKRNYTARSMNDEDSFLPRRLHHLIHGSC